MNTTPYVIASAWKRIVSGIIDVIFQILCLGLFSLIAGVGEQSFGTFNVAFSLQGWPLSVGLLLCFILLAVMEYKTGKTPGKYFLNIKVLSESYAAIDLKQALLRNLARYIDILFFYLLGLIIILCTKENQRFGDILARTYVVDD